MNQKKSSLNTESLLSLKTFYNFEIFGIPFILFISLIFLMFIVHITDSLPKNIIGGISLMFVLGAIFGEIGNRLPLFNKYIGGAPVLIFLVSALFVQQGLLTQNEINIVTAIMKETNLLDLFIAVLITSSILSVNRFLLLKSLIGYIPTIIAAIIGASFFGIMGAILFNIPIDEIMMLYVLPIMSGGNGAGAIPLSEIYESVTGNAKEHYYSVAIAILTIANAVAIIFAACLNTLGNIFPSLTGDDTLLRKSKLNIQTAVVTSITSRDIAIGLAITACIYAFSYALSENILPNFWGIKIHTFAYMVLITAVLNIIGICPDNICEGTKRLGIFFTEHLLWILMVGVGIAHTDLDSLFLALTFTNVIIAAFIVCGAVIGAALGGWIMGFYPIDAAITAGLCMANRGGSGDLEVLTASNRVSLISYAQISSRLGGGITLIISSILFGLF